MERPKARIRIGELHKKEYLMIELFVDGGYELGTAFSIEKLNDEKLVQALINKLAELKYYKTDIIYETKALEEFELTEANEEKDY